MIEAANPGDGALDAQAKAAVGYGAELAQLDVPVIGIGRQLVLLDGGHQLGRIAHALPDDPAADVVGDRFRHSLPVAANLALPISLSVDPMPDALRAEVEALAEATGLDRGALDRPVSSLDSLGRACLHLARALAASPRLPLPEPVMSSLIVPVAFFTIMSGLFLIVSRRKALTQVLGYLVLENGIYAFGVALVDKQPLLVELGWLLAGVPEELGGLGQGLAGACVLQIELGRRLAAVPFLPAALALDAVCQSTLADRAQWVERLTTGEYVAAPLAESAGMKVSDLWSAGGRWFAQLRLVSAA